MVYLYAFRGIKTGVFHYVGQTINLRARKLSHQAWAGKKHSMPEKTEFIVLREIAHDDTRRIERQVILALRKRGECSLNIHPIISRRNQEKRQYQILETGEVFNSLGAVGKYFGCSFMAVTYALKRYGWEMSEHWRGKPLTVKLID